MSSLAEVEVEGASRANEGGAVTLVGMHFTGRNYRTEVIYLHLKYIRLLLNYSKSVTARKRHRHR